MGGTMKLGLKKTIINNNDTIAYKIYNSSVIHENIVIDMKLILFILKK